jgi:serine/threonine protein kinase
MPDDIIPRAKAPPFEPGQNANPASPEANAADNGELATGVAPPFRALETAVFAKPPVFPEPGQRIGDFAILEILGEGAFGKVFLAQQLSLERLVALKVTAVVGREARVLASLEHDHIVHVISEVVDPQQNLRLLCMQYIAGTTLQRIIQALGQRPRENWSGLEILEVIDSLSLHPAPFHPAALRDRELLVQADFVQAVCWIGARLAEALDYAHARGIRHRDIKPANILVNQFGRPLLADFNLSLNVHQRGPVRLGGTLGYMAPEHLDAFDPDAGTPWTVVDQRSDIYSLGAVLHELLTGRRPFHDVGEEIKEVNGEFLRAMSAARRSKIPSARLDWPDTPKGLDHVLRRCLEPDPQRRYQTAGELAQALEGCREQQRIERELPHPGLVTSAALRHPWVMLLLLGVFPHVLGSLVNAVYNIFQIISHLTLRQQATFVTLLIAYNLAAYTFCLGVMVRLLWPDFRELQSLSRGEVAEGPWLNEVRRRFLALPMRAVLVSCLGWLPGGLLYPLGIHFWAGPLNLAVYAHFILSLTVSGLIALTYSYFGVQFMVLRVFYPWLWTEAKDRRQTTRAELASVQPRLRRFQLLAGVIPLTAAFLMVDVGPDIAGYHTFRLLILFLVALSLAGFVLAISTSNLLSQTLAVLTVSEGQPPEKSRIG